MIFRKRFESEEYTVVTSENMEEVFSNLSFVNVYFKDGLRIGDMILEETDYEHPFVIDNSFEQSLYINEDWYKEHLEEGREFLKQIILRNQSKKLAVLSVSLIDNSLLDSIKEAGFVRELDLGRDYCLTISDYEKLKGSSIEVLRTRKVETALQDIYEPFLDYNWNRPLIGYNSYGDLVNAKTIKVTKEEEIPYLKFLPLSCELVIAFKEELLTKILETNYPGPITIEVKDKKSFNQYLKKHPIEHPNVSVLVKSEKVVLPLYQSLEEKLDNMVKGAEGLSPLERYLYVYNIVKQFKEYKENEDARWTARNLYQILQNEYIVCVGFSAMLIDLCARVGISAHYLHTVVDVSYDKYDAGKEDLEIPKKLEEEGHARAQIYINDPKYHLNGYYVADATWDNELEHDSYLYALMTVEERLAAKRFIISDYLAGEEFFDCQSLDIFYAKVNRALDLLEPKNNEKKFDDNSSRMLLNTQNEQTRIRNLKKIVDVILEKLCSLNPDFTAKLKEQYPCLDDVDNATKQDYYDVITELGNHIVPMCNRQISGADLFRAVKEVYVHGYGYTGDELSTKLAASISYNKNSYDKRFPVRTREYEDGYADIYKSVPNKYDIPLPPGFHPELEVEETVKSR